MRDARRFVNSIVVAAWLVGACEAETPAADPADVAVEAAPEPEPEPEPKPEPKPEPAPKVEEPVAPAQPAFDVLAVSAIEAEIVEVHRKHWTACGRVHVVGLIEVEVLGVGEPRPRVGLVISCPVDLGKPLRPEVGKQFRFELHDKRPPRLPRPTVAPPEGLPVRYVRSFELLPSE